jgi:hypothetical protein
VFYTDQKAYQFRVITDDGKIFEPKGIYYTQKAAEEAARFCLIEQNLSDK